MRIGIVTTWFERGAAYVSKQYKTILEDAGHQVYIFARGGETYAQGDVEWDHPTITWSKKHSRSKHTEFYLSEFEHWINRHHIETVFFNEQHWWPPVLLCHTLGVKTGAYIDYYKEVTLPYYHLHDFLICNTKRHYEAFQWHPQAYYVPWGTDINLFNDSTSSKHPDVLTFFHSAGMSPKYRKGTHWLLEAFEAINHAHIRLLIHTQTDLYRAMPTYTSLIDRLVKGGKLEIIQRTVAAPGLYHKGDVYVYPTKLEGIGLTIAEALSCGLPVIVPDYPPMNEFVNQQNGRLVAVDRLFSRSDGYYWPQCKVSLPALTKAMQYYVDHFSRIKALKAAAREYACTYLDWKKNAQTVPAIFNESIFITDKLLPTDVRLEQNLPRFIQADLLGRYAIKAIHRIVFKKWKKRF